MFFDPMYFIFIAPALILAMWAQYKVKSAFARMSKVRVSSGMTGAEAAEAILRANGLYEVGIQQVQGMLSDHYDPRKNVLRLSPSVYNGRSLASVGVAAHEVGHALQKARNYAPLAIRNGIVPMAQVGPMLSFGLIFAGLIFSLGPLVYVGIALFGAFVLFQLVNLPVEFDASHRARKELLANGIVTQAEDKGVGQVLNAAAMTYVAATLQAVLTLLYYVSLVSGGGRRN